ncbi:hypothetical protein C6A85_63335, partial [Mycobacterium sp. ITM-2017-0098]
DGADESEIHSSATDLDEESGDGDAAQGSDDEVTDAVEDEAVGSRIADGAEEDSSTTEDPASEPTPDSDDDSGSDNSDSSDSSDNSDS